MQQALCVYEAVGSVGFPTARGMCCAGLLGLGDDVLQGFDVGVVATVGHGIHAGLQPAAEQDQRKPQDGAQDRVPVGQGTPASGCSPSRGTTIPISITTISTVIAGMLNRREIACRRIRVG